MQSGWSLSHRAISMKNIYTICSNFKQLMISATSVRNHPRCVASPVNGINVNKFIEEQYLQCLPVSAIRCRGSQVQRCLAACRSRVYVGTSANQLGHYFGLPPVGGAVKSRPAVGSLGIDCCSAVQQ